MNRTVRDAMTVAPLIVISADDDLEAAGKTLAWSRVRHLPVMDNGVLVGILSERDFLRALAAGGKGAGSKVRFAMQSPVVSVGPDEPIASALSLMVSRNIGCLAVISSAGLEGMLTTTDLLRHQLYAEYGRRPGVPAAQFDLRVEPASGFRFQVRFDKDQYLGLQTDEPPPLGQDSAPNPARILAAAVGTCLSASLRFCLQRAGVNDAAVSADVHVDVVRNERKRLRIGRIDVRLRPGAAVDPKAVASCLETFEDFCVVTESVRQGIPVHVQVGP